MNVPKDWFFFYFYSLTGPLVKILPHKLGGRVLMRSLHIISEKSFSESCLDEITRKLGNFLLEINGLVPLNNLSRVITRRGLNPKFPNRKISLWHGIVDKIIESC